MGEFELIARYLRPLAGEGAMELKDDAARSFGRVLTKDVLVEGTHFLSGDPLDLLARKALRVNMSDLIAKGARPESYLLGLVWPSRLGEEGFARFAGGLAEEQRLAGLSLLGGDTTRGEALVISVTMFGAPLGQRAVLRSGGEIGDLLCVSGTIGDGLLGLEAARRSEEEGASPYHLPRIPLGAEGLVAAHAKASLDVSDGLVADARHLAEASGVSLRINARDVPLSAAGRKAAENGRLGELLTGGDDYQTLCLVDRSDAGKLTGFKVIGEAVEGANACGVDVALPDGSQWRPAAGGWDHFGR